MELSIPCNNAKSGAIDIVIVDSNTITVRFNESNPIIFHGVGYRGYVNVRREGDGWKSSDRYINRKDWATTFKEPTWQQVHKIVDLCVSTVDEWTKNNPRTAKYELYNAETLRMTEDRDRLNTKIIHMQAEIKNLEAERDELTRQIGERTSSSLGGGRGFPVKFTGV
jgi:hypothetical protein